MTSLLTRLARGRSGDVARTFTSRHALGEAGPRQQTTPPTAIPAPHEDASQRVPTMTGMC
jgi:hypothetical protein